jgi:hypothetical protein
MLLLKLAAILPPAALCAGLALCATPLPAGTPVALDRNSPAVQAFSAIPGWFEPQRPGVYVSHGHAPTVAMQERGIFLSLPTGNGQPARVLPVSLPGAHWLRWTGECKLPGTTSYFTGSDRALWRTGVPQFARVRAPSVWPGVDLLIYSQARRMEYDFILAPGSDLRRVRLQFGPGWRASVDDAGDLQLTDGTVTFRQLKPVAWQHRAGQRVDLATNFRLQRDGSVGFDVHGYDPARELVIDPVLGFAGYISGDTEDTVYGVAAVSDGYWLVGSTGSTFTIPTTITPFQAARDAFLDIFLAKITVSSTGTPVLAYYTYIGGSDNDIPAAIAAAPDGTLAVVGTTYSKDFPVTTANAFQSTYAGEWDAFVLKFDPSQVSTSQLVYASYFGGGDNDYGTGVAFDPQGNIIAVGTTPVTSLPQTPVNAGIQTASAGAQDIFVLQVDPFATTPAASLLYATLLGGNLTDIPYAVAVDAHGRIYLAGSTASGNFPLAGVPYQSNLSSWENAFLSVIDPTQAPASQLVYSTYLGGEGDDVATALALDAQGRVWLAGYTTSTRFPVTSGAVQTTFSGIAAAWLARVDITQSGSAALTYSTYFNGSQTTVPFALALDSLGRPTIGGYTRSTDLPIVAPISIQSTLQLQNAFVATIDPAQSGPAGLVFSTTFGGSTLNTVTSLAADAAGNLIVGGYTDSADFPVTDGSTRLSPAGADAGFYLLLQPDPAAQRNLGVPERPGRRRVEPERIVPPTGRPASSSSPWFTRSDQSY